MKLLMRVTPLIITGMLVTSSSPVLALTETVNAPAEEKVQTKVQERLRESEEKIEKRNEELSKKQIKVQERLEAVKQSIIEKQESLKARLENKQTETQQEILEKKLQNRQHLIEVHTQRLEHRFHEVYFVKLTSAIEKLTVYLDKTEGKDFTAAKAKLAEAQTALAEAKTLSDKTITEFNMIMPENVEKQVELTKQAQATAGQAREAYQKVLSLLKETIKLAKTAPQNQEKPAEPTAE